MQVGLKHLVLGRRSNPEANNKDVIVLGTYATASAWSRSQFKSGDGTFKMTVKTFYQVFPYHDNDDEATCLVLMDFNSDLHSSCAAGWCIRALYNCFVARQEAGELRRSLLADLGLPEST